MKYYLIITLACIIRYFKTKKDNIKKHKFNKDAYKVAYISTSVLIAIIFILEALSDIFTKFFSDTN